jgi:hypothetical protein
MTVLGVCWLTWRRYFADLEEEIGVPVHELSVAVSAPVDVVIRNISGAPPMTTGDRRCPVSYCGWQLPKLKDTMLTWPVGVMLKCWMAWSLA